MRFKSNPNVRKHPKTLLIKKQGKREGQGGRGQAGRQKEEEKESKIILGEIQTSGISQGVKCDSNSTKSACALPSQEELKVFCAPGQRL